MHYYSIDKEFRKTTYVVLTIISLSIPSFINSCQTIFGLTPEVGFSISFGSIFTFLYFIVEKWAWKILPIPDLNGSWDAEGISSYQDPTTGENYRYKMDVEIKQSFTKLEVFTQTSDSTSRSTMASICTDHALSIFRYSFENVPMNTANDELQRHPGLIEMRIKSKDELQGDYFSGKHRLRYGTLTFKRNKQ